jgi:hypothetical protein
VGIAAVAVYSVTGAGIVTTVVLTVALVGWLGFALRDTIRHRRTY